MPAPLVHIGYHKTGSSWLQKFVFNKPKGGFSAFDKGAGGPIDRFLVAPNSLDFDLAAARGHFEPEIEAAEQQGRVAVISSERLSGHPLSGGYDSKELADRLAEAFPQGRVLIVIREQRDIVLSAYKQYVRGGGAWSLRQYLDPARAGHPRIPGFDPLHFAYHRLIGRYRELFTPDRVLVLTYELLGRDPQSFVSAVAAFAGVRLDRRFLERLPVERRPNLGYSAAAMEAKRSLNRLFARSDLNPAPPLPWARADALARRHVGRVDEVVPHALEAWLDHRARATVEAALAGRFRDSNRLTAELTGLDLAGYGYEVAAR